MATIQDLIQIAQNEVGYLEKASNKDLDSKTANAGYNNWTKYARDLDALGNFYNGKKNGYAWCDVFVDWCFVKTFGRTRGQQLVNQPNYSLGAGVGYSKKYYQNENSYVKTPQPGDQIFFKNAAGSMQHTGLVYKTDSTYVYTIEGNTSSGSSVVANGGAVCAKKYKLNNQYIDGYGRPLYTEEEKHGSTPTPVKPLYSRYVSDVDYEGLNVRTTAGGALTGKTVLVGTKVDVYEVSGSWSRIGQNQWVYSAYLKKSKPNVKTVNAKDGLNVRKSYTSSSALITTLPYGTPVQVFATKKGWVKVSPDSSAWVAGNYLK